MLRFLEAYLVRTTERVEIENRANDITSDNSDPEIDTIPEIEPTLDKLAVANPRYRDESQEP